MKANKVLLGGVLTGLFGLALLGRHNIQTEITINASPERVWQIITDTARYPEWNPIIVRLQGKLQPGQTIEFENRNLEGRPMTFRPTILKAENNRELRWLGRLWIPRLFDGEHYFILTPTAADQTRLEHGEHFQGALVPFVSRWLNGEIKGGFIRINTALKTRAEGQE